MKFAKELHSKKTNTLCKHTKGFKMPAPAKIYFATPEELKTPEYIEYVKWMAEVWKANSEKNK